MNFIRKIVAGGPGRITRFHSENDTVLPIYELRHLPRVTGTYFFSKLSGKRPDVPWWPINAIAHIDSIVTPESRVVEFGSGSSTIWLAKRAASVTSYEDHKDWHTRVCNRIAKLDLHNVDISLAPGDQFWKAVRHVPDRFDLAIVDGSYRWKCIESILPKMKSGGFLYLDNSDADKDLTLYDHPSQTRLAQKIMQDYANNTPGAELYSMTSLVSGELYVGEGMFLRIP